MDTFLWSRDIVAPIVFPFIYCILIGKPLLDEAISITGVEDVIDRLLVGFGSRRNERDFNGTQGKAKNAVAFFTNSPASASYWR